MTATKIQPVAEICSASHDDAQFGERAIKPLCDISSFDYGTPLYAGAAPAAVAGRTTPRNDDERAAAQFFADNPGAALLAWPLYLARDKSHALEAPAAPAVPLKATPEMRAAFRHAYRKGAYREREIWSNRVDYALDQMLAAAPQAPAAPSIPQWIDDPHDIEQGQMLNPAWVKAQAAPPAPVAPAATMFHDAGAIAQCTCGRYTLDRNSLSPRDDRRPVCECGTNHGWSGSFKKPGADSKWHGPAPAPEAAPAAPAVDAQAHDWRENASYGGEICAECGAAKGSRRGNAPCAWPPEPLDVCTDPYNCARCKAHPNHRGGLEHAGISRPRSAAQAKEGGAAC